MNSVSITWAEVKTFSANSPLQFVETNKHYHLWVNEGGLIFSCRLLKDAGADVTEFEADYKANANKPVAPRTSLTIPKVAVYEPDGFFKSYVSHNLCDPTTWYQDSVQVTGQTLTLDTGLIYDFPQQNIIDIEHGKITGEKNYSLDFSTFTYTQSLRDIYKVVIYDNGTVQTSGYTIDYAAGKVTFDSSPTGPLTADYYYENGSNFKVQASAAGKVLQIRHVEIQFTKNITFSGAIIQSVKAYNPMDLPNKIEVEHIEFLNEQDVINIGNGGKGFIPQYGALGHDILVFPFSYGRTIDLASSTGAEINVKVEDDVPMGGDYGTVTFYTTEDDE